MVNNVEQYSDAQVKGPTKIRLHNYDHMKSCMKISVRAVFQ